MVELRRSILTAWTTDNYLPIVGTIIESLESISINKEQVVVVIQSM